MYVNKNDTDAKCAKNGAKAEDRFVEIVKKKKIDFRKAEKEEQKRFIDIILKINNKVVGIDVKAIKNIKRGIEDSEFPIWVEFKNVWGGRGWVFGSADFIAFERPNNFIIIKRKSLLNWCVENIDFENKVTNPKNAYKKVYTRRGREDLITYVKYSDISHLIYRKWNKVEGAI